MNFLGRRIQARFSIPVIALGWGLSIAAQQLPEGKGKPILETTCTECHGLDMIIEEPRTKGQWESVVNKMRQGGANVSDQQFGELVAYLMEHFGPEEGDKAKADPDKKPAEKINVNKATAKELETALQFTTAEAAAIVRYRESKGEFKGWQDLTKVEGVDKAKIEAKKDRLSF